MWYLKNTNLSINAKKIYWYVKKIVRASNKKIQMCLLTKKDLLTKKGGNKKIPIFY